MGAITGKERKCNNLEVFYESVITATNKRIKNCNIRRYINHFLRRQLLVSYFRSSVHFMKQEGSLPSSQQPVTTVYFSESESILQF